MAGTKKTTAQLYTDRTSTVYSNGVNAINGANHAMLIDDILASHANKISDNNMLGLFPYDTTRTYYIGQAVTYDDGGGYAVYICNNATTTGVWNASHWNKVELSSNIRKGIVALITDPQTITFTSSIGTTNYVLTFRIYDSVTGEGASMASCVVTKGSSGFTISSPLIGANVIIEYKAEEV